MNDYVSVLKSGQRYLHLWPRERSLFAIFPESRVVLALEWAVRVVPAIIFCTLFTDAGWTSLFMACGLLYFIGNAVTGFPGLLLVGNTRRDPITSLAFTLVC